MSVTAALALLGALALAGLVWLARAFGDASRRLKDAEARERRQQEVDDAVAEVDESVGIASRRDLIERMRARGDGD